MPVVNFRHNWNYFAICYGWDVTSGNLSKSAFFEAGGSLWVQNSDGRGRCLPTTVGVRKAEWLPFRAASKYSQCVVWYCHKARVWHTDGRTDGQNYDSQDRASIAASRGKKQFGIRWCSSVLSAETGGRRRLMGSCQITWSHCCGYAGVISQAYTRRLSTFSISKPSSRSASLNSLKGRDVNRCYTWPSRSNLDF